MDEKKKKAHVVIYVDKSKDPVEPGTLGYKLKELRIKSGMTQQKAADAIGIKRDVLKNYELNARKPDYDRLKVFADFYNTTINYLLGYEETYEQKYSDQTQILLQTLKEASEKEIAQAVKIVEALKGTMPDD